MAGTRPRATILITILLQAGFQTTLPYILFTEGSDHKHNFLFFLNISWDRACPDLKEEITLSDAVDNTLGLTGGYLGLVGAEAGFDKRFRIPGTSMRYQCSEGFHTGSGNNPVQVLTCTAGRKVDLSGLSQCRRKEFFHIL